MAWPVLTMKLAWSGLIWAPPICLPFKFNFWSIISPAGLSGDGFLKTQPAEFMGWVRDFFWIVSWTCFLASLESPGMSLRVAETIISLYFSTESIKSEK